MSMNVGGGGGSKSEINVTPLVDVVLVLLIIFMVVTPMLQMGYEVKTPPKVKTATPQPPDPNQIIVRMDADGQDLHQQASSSAEAEFTDAAPRGAQEPREEGRLLRRRRRAVVREGRRVHGPGAATTARRTSGSCSTISIPPANLFRSKDFPGDRRSARSSGEGS